LVGLLTVIASDLTVGKVRLYEFCGGRFLREPVGAFGWYLIRRSMQFPVGAFGWFGGRAVVLHDRLAVAWRNGVGLC
jgi:hypothetical protein